MGKLLDAQFEFSRDLGKLLIFLYESGYTCSMGECLRTPEQAKYNADHGLGISKSVHLLKLAVDLNIFKDGQLLSKREDLEPIGIYWESLGINNCWGGDFTKYDGGHFSHKWEGRA